MNLLPDRDWDSILTTDRCNDTAVFLLQEITRLHKKCLMLSRGFYGTIKYRLKQFPPAAVRRRKLRR